MNYSMTFISEEVAKKLNLDLPGIPTENRVLILSPKEVNQTKSGIIIPGQVKEGVPRKGVIVKRGEITEEYKTYKDLVKIGRVVTYGLYAGKELDLELDDHDYINELLKNNILTVLSLNEIIYVEQNNN